MPRPTARTLRNDLPGYHAVYVASYQGRAVGKAEFSVTLLDAEYGIYEFSLRITLQGLVQADRTRASGRIEQICS